MLGIYLMTVLSDDGEEFSEEIIAYSQEQAWHFALEYYDSNRIVSITYCGKYHKSVSTAI